MTFKNMREIIINLKKYTYNHFKHKNKEQIKKLL